MIARRFFVVATLLALVSMSPSTAAQLAAQETAQDAAQEAGPRFMNAEDSQRFTSVGSRLEFFLPAPLVGFSEDLVVVDCFSTSVPTGIEGPDSALQALAVAVIEAN